MQRTFIVSKATEYKIDLLLEEVSAFNKIQNKVDDLLEKFNKKFSTKRSRDSFVQKEKAARKRREDYLKKNNIDISQFKKDLKAGKNVKISFEHTIKEIIAELKGTHPIEMVKTLTILAIVVMINTMISYMFPDIVTHFFIGAVIIGPLIEELYRKYSVKNKTSLGGLLSITSGEFGIDIMNNDVGPGRLTTTLIHALLTFIHTKGNIRDEYKKDFNIKTEDKNKYKNEAGKLATIVHSVANLTSPFRPF